MVESRKLYREKKSYDQQRNFTEVGVEIDVIILYGRYSGRILKYFFYLKNLFKYRFFLF